MAEALNNSIEIHDSVLTSVERKPNQVKLSLEAYVHKSAGVPGVDPGSGWMQNVILTIDSGSFEGNTIELPCELTDGSLEIEGELMKNLIPIPLHRNGHIVLTLIPMWTDNRLLAHGGHISLELIGEARYVEEFP